MRDLFSRLFSPREEASQDPRVVIEATLAAEARLRQYASEREERMARVRLRAERSGTTKHRAPVLAWTQEAGR